MFDQDSGEGPIVFCCEIIFFNSVYYCRILTLHIEKFNLSKVYGKVCAHFGYPKMR